MLQKILQDLNNEDYFLKDPLETARLAGLVYVTGPGPGIGRKKVGKHFSYTGLDGKPIREQEELKRIKALGIPPAYTEVWICPNPDGHLQATGRDAKGRKQYRYHSRWREVRDETKYGRMIQFGLAIPQIRAQVEKSLSLPGLPREKVLATVVRLLENTLIRVGNEEYARTNKSFGLTTMRDRHVKIEGSEVKFQFRGKSGKDHSITLKDRRLARIVKSCRDIPGYELFQYLDEQGQRQSISSSDVNAYLREITGHDFTAKDFRTWAGTIPATLALQEFEPYENQTQAKKNIVEAIKNVSERLGNTPAICRKCYVHPAVLDAYLEGPRLDILQQRVGQEIEDNRLRPEEAGVLTFLKKRLDQEEASDAQGKTGK